MKNQKNTQRLSKNKENIIVINQNSIAMGILQETSKFVKGAIIETCQKLKIIIGKVKTRAEKVIDTAVFISKKFGKNLKILSKNFWL